MSRDKRTDHLGADECGWEAYPPPRSVAPEWRNLLSALSFVPMALEARVPVILDPTSPADYLTDCDPGDEDDGETHPDGWKEKEEK